MIMSVHDPLSRKRSLSNPNGQEGSVSKKLKMKMMPQWIGTTILCSLKRCIIRM